MWVYKCEVFEDTYHLIACELTIGMHLWTLILTSSWYSGKDLTYILACLSSVVRKMTAYQLNNCDVNAFVELFDMCM